MAIISGQTYRFTNAAFPSKALNVYASGTTISARRNVCLYDSDATDVMQQWVPVGNETDGYFLKCNASIGYALHYATGADSGSCAGNTDVKNGIAKFPTEFLVDFIYLGNNQVKIKRRGSNDYLTAYNDVTPNSNNISVKKSDGNVYWSADDTLGNKQVWYITPKIDNVSGIQLNGLDTYGMIDFEGTMDAIVESGEDIKFICRYFSETNSPTTNKVLELEEAQIISNKGFDIVSIYQDGSGLSQYQGENLVKDPEKAYLCARAVNQPGASALFLPVDNIDPSLQQIETYIVPYFEAVKTYLNAQPIKYKIGVYGTGLVCRTIKQEYGLADYSWLAASTGTRGSAAYNDPTLYDIKQFTDQPSFNGTTFDRDISGYNADFGQWSL